jgi:aspartyl-tRNA(Asn)/glutamyl-tRNA(Gln) amidotransferase subunit A
VADRLCFGSLGSDTGGSIRIPASLCGIVGLKPTYGRVSRHGALPLCWSLDHVGPMARTVRDTALLLEAIAGSDPADPSSLPAPVKHQEFSAGLETGVRGLTLGVPREHFWDCAQPEVAERVRAAISALEAQGAEVREVSLPTLPFMSLAQSTIILAEASAVHRHHLRERAAEYGARVRVRLMEGLFISAPDYLDALRTRKIIRRELVQCLSEVDALLTPATPITAPLIGQATQMINDVEMPTSNLLVWNTAPFNLTGLPAVSVPCGTVNGLPVGLQIAGGPLEEALILRVARAVEVLQAGA